MSRFNIGEWKKCRLFVEMELAGQRPLQIYDHLMRTRKKLRQWSINNTYIEALPGLSKKSFLNKVSRLTNAVENYISYRELNQKPQVKKLLLRKYYLSNKDELEWESSFKKSLEQYSKQNSVSYQDQLTLLQVLHQAYHNTHPYKNEQVIDIMNHLQHTVGNSLKSYEAYLKMIRYHEDYISKPAQKSIPLHISSRVPQPIIYDLIVKSYIEYNHQTYEQIVENLTNNEQYIDTEILTVIYGILKKILTNELLKRGSQQVAMNLYELSKKEMALIASVGLPLNTEKLYFLMLLLDYTNDLDEMRSLLEKHEDTHSHSPFYQMSRSIYLLSKGQIGDGIDTINSINSDSIVIKHRIRSLQIKSYCTYYDQTEFCLDEIKKFKLWLRYNAEYLSKSSILASLNLMDIITLIIKNHPVEKVIHKMKKYEFLSSRMWIHKELKRRYQVSPPDHDLNLV